MKAITEDRKQNLIAALERVKIAAQPRNLLQMCLWI